MSAPLILLDVDGVLNAVIGRSGAVPYGDAADWLRVDVNGYPIAANRTVLRRISDWHTSGRAEVRWLTTWEIGDLANTHLGPALGLPEFAVEGRAKEFPPAKFSDHGHWWKLGVAQRAAEREPDRVIVWIDDDHPAYSRAAGWIETTSGRVLHFAPETHVGLHPDDLDNIDGLLGGAS